MKKAIYSIGTEAIEFSTPSIKKTFWFPEDARTIDEWNEVQEHVASCENENYFISENLSNTDAAKYLHYMEDKRFRLWWCKMSWNGNESTWIAGGYYTDMTYDRYFVREINDSEREQLRSACNAEQAKFTKRLRTYLKRYGLSKCRFDTFWSNR